MLENAMSIFFILNFLTTLNPMTLNHDTALWMSGVFNPIAQSGMDIYILEF